MTARGIEKPLTGQRARTEATRQALLTAAREAFTSQGYTATGVDDIVERSGISIGSLYHHFGGKSGLYLALWEGYVQQKEASAAAAVSAARRAGGTDPVALLLTGARAWLQISRENRDLALLFMDGDHPEGFVKLRRDRGRAWIRTNTRLFRDEETERSRRLLTLVLTTAIGEAGREVATAADDAEAAAIIDDTCRILSRLSR